MKHRQLLRLRSNSDYELEFSEHSLLVELVGAVLDVDLKMFGRMLQEDVADLTDQHVLLPALL